jgi:hypothetical protein
MVSFNLMVLLVRNKPLANLVFENVVRILALSDIIDDILVEFLPISCHLNLIFDQLLSFSLNCFGEFHQIFIFQLLDLLRLERVRL